MRLLILLMLASVISTPALAQPDPGTSPLDPIYRCADITSQSERLACFDQAVAQVRASSSEGRFMVIDREQAVAAQRESFGFSLPLIARMFSASEDDIQQVEAQIANVARRGNGLYAFELSNGQVWVQTEAQRVNNVRANDTVQVRRALFGSFLLSSQRGGEAHRVRRED